MNNYETNLSIKKSLPQGVVAPDNGVPVYSVKLPLTAAELEQVRTALEHGRRKYENKVNEVAEITRDLKIMAGDLNAVVILLSQLNRDVEKRAIPRPVLSDLRDSGSIEQDANSIIFLSKTNPNDLNSDILAEVAKNRSGAVGQVVFAFDRNVQTFRETDREYKPCNMKDRDYRSNLLRNY